METELHIIDGESMQKSLAYVWQRFREREMEMEHLAESHDKKLCEIFGMIAVKFLAFKE